ncbi:hypothetical protein ACOKM5_14560 [Streptomyces sp. BH097]|uniref:hypothetical protein n=1 Tax=unclassified Streptomyces TaxID=2593676 RepID=UPI003BB499BF
MNAFDENNDVQLTPAAEAALHDALKEISAEITFRAAANAHKGTRDSTLVGVLDVAEALSETRRRQNGLPSRIRSLFLATGFYGVTGFFVFLYTLTKDNPNSTLQFAGGLLMGIGVPALTYSLLYRFFGAGFPFQRKASIQAEGSEQLLIFRAWLEVESAIRSYYSNRHGESRATAPIVEMVRALSNDQVISPEITDKIQRLRIVRNSLAHGLELNLSSKEARDFLKDAQIVLNALRA